MRFDERMEALLLGALIAIALFIAAMVWVSRIVRGVSRQGRDAQARAPQILDEAFDGRRDVTFTIGPGNLRFEETVLGARERGYTLTGQSLRDSLGTQTLVFARDAQS